MNKLLKKQIIIIFILAFCGMSYGQRGKAVLILKDSTLVNGMGEISGISSIVSAKFGNDTLRYKSYTSKEIIGIDILENNYFRKYRYKFLKEKGKKKRFPELMEVVSIDSLSLYVRFYEGGVLTNSFQHNTTHKVNTNYPFYDNRMNEFVLENGETIKINNRTNVYTEVNIPRYSYYVGHGISDEVEHLYTKGLPFAKNFKSAMKEYFTNCPELIEKVEIEAFKNNEIWKVLEFYNKNCIESSSE